MVLLQWFWHMAELDFERLMAVYREGNRENALDLYPDMPVEAAQRRAEQDFREYLQEDFFVHKGACYCVWEESGQYLSALRLEPWQDGLLLEALETHPDFRKQGYAKKLILAVQLELTGKRVYSHVSKKNKASLATHQSCGFSIIRDFVRMLDGTVSSRSWTLMWQANSK